MGEPMFDAVAVAAGNAKPQPLRATIRQLVLANNAQCYNEMEPYLIKGVTGNRQFDQHSAVLILLEHDANASGEIAAAMDAIDSLNQHGVWNLLSDTLRSIGFNMRQGRLVGLLQHKPAEDDSD